MKVGFTDCHQQEEQTSGGRFVCNLCRHSIVPIEEAYLRLLADGAGIGLPASMEASIQTAIAESNSVSASTFVFPQAEQPGRSDAMAIKPSSFSLQKISIGYRSMLFKPIATADFPSSKNLATLRERDEGAIGAVWINPTRLRQNAKIDRPH